MKKFVTYFLPVLTLAVGYSIRMIMEEPAETIVKEKIVYKNPVVEKESNVKDSVKKQKDKRPDKSSEEITEIEVDSLLLSDTLIVGDSLEMHSDSLQIKRDRVVKKTWLTVKKSESKMNKIDSLKMEGMGIRKVGFSDKVLVEFWESPFNFSGYKLSKSKLIVYGLDPSINYFLIDSNNDTLEMNSSDDSFNFVFTEDFLPLQPNANDSL